MKQKFQENFKACPVKNEACTIFYKIVEEIRRLVLRRTVRPTFAVGKMARYAAFPKCFVANKTSRTNVQTTPGVEPGSYSVVVAADETVCLFRVWLGEGEMRMQPRAAVHEFAARYGKRLPKHGE